MVAPARTPAPSHLELPVNEARTRFLQLVRQIRATRQTVLIVDQGRPVAAIGPPDLIAARHPDVAARHPDVAARHPDVAARHPDVAARHPDVAARHPDVTALDADVTALDADVIARRGDATARRGDASARHADAATARLPDATAAGWAQRLETVRHDMRRQHAAHTAELLQALVEAWNVIDTLRSPGPDRHIDALRTSHKRLRRRE
ncbi:type II toxin-antitoxin system Phd/YefM family antitoxin [Actinoplanes sp. TBRC 11911]|uniref:type II toxin-antitoxin system Phd/YefM family antitoxin n=1 Tax=Actinoplanes sp. TBRC 11911 TaxID=2729386 RepID=UPI00145F3809|nr:type II toxin-antitoxin system Phd/YefM family antitoxin [Actinoplanes sp. TBRC 11911]NMO51495.1 type II toxin-antitoxin system Phd/YefM family antitoxin [Actinoplanes sp. TBRC 11911]